MAQLPKGGLVRGHDKPIHGSCAIYFPGGIDSLLTIHFMKATRTFTTSTGLTPCFLGPEATAEGVAPHSIGELRVVLPGPVLEGVKPRFSVWSTCSLWVLGSLGKFQPFFGPPWWTFFSLWCETSPKKHGEVSSIKGEQKLWTQ